MLLLWQKDFLCRVYSCRGLLCKEVIVPRNKLDVTKSECHAKLE
jgi:hypothetical protein